MGWVTSTRRQQLPGGWRQLRALILERDGYRCYVCGRHVTELAPHERLEVDHVARGADHRPQNLAAICSTDHARKSAREGVAARPTRRRPPERHPGLR